MNGKCTRPRPLAEPGSGPELVASFSLEMSAVPVCMCVCVYVRAHAHATHYVIIVAGP